MNGSTPSIELAPEAKKTEKHHEPSSTPLLDVPVIAVAPAIPAPAKYSIENIGLASEGKRNNFHLMRLIAALLVIYGHARAIAGNGQLDFIQLALGLRFAGSFATDTFFILSGFLITASIERSSLPHYLWARFLRIFPALILCIVLTVFVLGPLVTNDPNYWSDPRTWNYLFNSSTLTGGQSVLPGVFTDHHRPSVNGSLWTLNIEVRLYLLVFLFAVLGLMKKNRLSWLIIGLFVMGFYYIPKFWPFSYMTTADRWLQPIGLFLAGAFVWKNRYKVPLSFPILAVFILICALTYQTPKFEIAYFAALLYSIFFVGYAVELPQIKFRDLSYGVYLYGWPAQQIVEHLRPNSTAMFNMVWAMALALSLAFISWELVEKRAMALKHLVK